jgi:transposase
MIEIERQVLSISVILLVRDKKTTERRLAMEKCNKLDFTGQSIYVGLDVHKKNWSVSIFSEQCEHKTFSQPPEVDKLVRYLNRNFPGADYHAVYEAGFSGFWVHDQLRERGVNCIVANPADVPTTDKERTNKRDKVDGRKLGRHLRAGELKGIYVPTRRQLEDRSLVRTRQSLVRKQTRCKNQIRAFLFFYGIYLDQELMDSPWSQKFIRRLESLSMTRASGDQALKAHLEELRHLRQIIASVNRAIILLSREPGYSDQVKRLRTVPGISTLSAMILLTELCELARFASLDRLASYAGLIPNVHISGETVHIGHLTYRRNAQLRHVLIEAAWTATRKDPVLLLAFNQYCRRMKKTRAIVKIARKLLNRIRYVLKNDRDYVPGVVQ